MVVMKMVEFNLDKQYDRKEYKKIVTIIESFKPIRTQRGNWWLEDSKIKTLRDALEMNLGYNPIELLSPITELHQILIPKINEKAAEILINANMDPETGIYTMDEKTFEQWSKFAFENDIEYYDLHTPEKIEIWEKESVLSMLLEIQERIEKLTESFASTNFAYESFLRQINDNQITLAEKLDTKIKKIHETIKTATKDTVVFRYTQSDAMMLFIDDDGLKRTIMLRYQDILTLPRDVAEELMKMGKGEIIEAKRTGEESTN